MEIGKGNFVMIRIAVVMGKMHSGGKKNLVMEYYRHIDRTKIQFDFICDADSNSIPKDEIEKLGGRVYIVPPYQNIFSNMHAIYKLCKKNQYQIIHGYNSTMNVFAMFAGKMAGVPIRINECISMGHKEDKKDKLKSILKPFSKCFSTHFMANGEMCGRWQFGDIYFDKGNVQVFKTVIDTALNTFNKDLREKTRETLGISDNIVVGHIGRLTIQKNTLFLIDVFYEIIKLEPKARLLIIGDGDLREKMLEKINTYDIRDKVIYLGRREDIQQFYNAMDVFLLPSLYEGLPVVGIEAECCGLPVIFSNEIPAESSPCNDLGMFINLKKKHNYWAKAVLSKARKSITNRYSHDRQLIESGFDSINEGTKLTEYYINLLS